MLPSSCPLSSPGCAGSGWSSGSGAAGPLGVRGVDEDRDAEGRAPSHRSERSLILGRCSRRSCANSRASRWRLLNLLAPGADKTFVHVQRFAGRCLEDLRSDPALSLSPREEIERVCMRNLLENPEERVYFKDRDSRFLLVSVGWLATVARGRSLDEVIGKTDFDIFSRQHAGAAFEDERRVLETGQPMLAKVERETFHDRPDAWVSTTKLPLLGAGGEIIGTWGISRDVTAQVAAEQALVHQALHDTVTGLPNRVLFEDRLSQALTAARRHDRQLAVLFVDLDRFKNINDSLGHSAGDEVLRSAAMRLADCLRPEDTLARMGGDEFAAVLQIGRAHV